MLILDAVTKSLKIVLAGAVATTQLPVTAHYTDITTTAYTPGSNDTVTNSTTVVEFVAAPAASTQRHVESISVYNVDTASATVTIQYVSAGGTRQIIKVILQTLEALYYEDGHGWQVIDSSGNIKTVVGGLTGLAITAGKTITVTQDTSLDEAVAMSSKAPKTSVIVGDGTADRRLRSMVVVIQNGTTAATLKVSTLNTFNSNAIAAEDNLAKAGSTASFTLNAAGSRIEIIAAAFTGTLLKILISNRHYNASGVRIDIVSAVATGNIRITGYDSASGAAVDLTTLVDTGEINVELLYLTSS